MTKFYGLAVGGVRNGEYLAHDSNVLRIPNPHGRTRYDPDGSVAGYQPDMYHTYVYITRYWWPYEPGRALPGLTTILDVVDRTYHEHASYKRTTGG